MTTVSFVFALALVLAVAASISVRKTIEPALRSVADTGSETEPVSIVPRTISTDERWSSDLGPAAVAPEEAPDVLPTLPGLRYVWSERDGDRGRTGWEVGYTTQAPAAEVGLAFLEHFESLPNWELLESDLMGYRGTGWGAVLVNEVDPAMVMVAAMPTKVLTSPGSGNPTRVYVVHITGEQATRDILGDALARKDSDATP